MEEEEEEGLLLLRLRIRILRSRLEGNDPHPSIHPLLLSPPTYHGVCVTEVVIAFARSWNIIFGCRGADSMCTREFFDVGQTVTLKWNNASTKYPSVTIVLWNPTADGLYWSLDGLDFITNVGFVQWTVPEIVGQHKLGIGNGINTHTPNCSKYKGAVG
jgi:hypothetical protein